MSRRRLPAIVAAAIAAGCILVPAAGADQQRGTERVAIFYYPWYSNPAKDGGWAHWFVDHSASVLSTPYYPSRGLYSSSSAKIVAAQMREIAAAGVGTLVVSWWGFDSPENDRLPMVEQAAAKEGLTIALHIEPYRGRTPAQAAEDIARLHEERGVVDFYVYDADRDPAAEWAEALAPLEGVRVFGHTTMVGKAKASGFDGLYTYDVLTWNGALFRRLCTQAHTAGLLCAPSVGPGYDARLTTGLESVRPRNDGRTYDSMWKTALRANPDVVTITSYNEWQEGTQIEPARFVTLGGPSYEDAWGKTGVVAQRAYLTATARWTSRLQRLPSQ